MFNCEWNDLHPSVHCKSLIIGFTFPLFLQPRMEFLLRAKLLIVEPYPALLRGILKLRVLGTWDNFHFLSLKFLEISPLNFQVKSNLCPVMLLWFCKMKYSNMGLRGFAMIHIDVGTCGSWVLSFIFFKTSFSLFHFNHAWIFHKYLGDNQGEKRGNIFLHVIIFFIANLKSCLHSRNSPALVYSILVIWTWSMLQFPLDLAGKYLMFAQRNRK